MRLRVTKGENPRLPWLVMRGEVVLSAYDSWRGAMRACRMWLIDPIGAA